MGDTILGLLIPFAGTGLGAAMVFFLKKQMSSELQKILTGFAAGVMVAASFRYGVLSGAVEPIAALVTILAASAVIPVLPYLLAFAAGVMMYVVVEELIPEMSEGEHSNAETIFFSPGFVLMMILDVTLG